MNQKPQSPLEQTVRNDVATVAIFIGVVVGFAAFGAGWLYLLYDPSVTAQSMIWFLGALPAAFVGGFVGKWIVVALLTR